MLSFRATCSKIASVMSGAIATRYSEIVRGPETKSLARVVITFNAAMAEPCTFMKARIRKPCAAYTCWQSKGVGKAVPNSAWYEHVHFSTRPEANFGGIRRFFCCCGTRTMIDL